MSSRPHIQTFSVREPVSTSDGSRVSKRDVAALNAMALQSLVSLFENNERLFSRRVVVTEGGVLREETSRKRTIIAVLGLQRLSTSGESIPFDVASIADEVLKDISWVRNVGDLGLLTWLTAECVPERLETLFDTLDFGKTLDHYTSVRPANTRELAWFLAGISHARLARPGMRADLTDPVVAAYRLLQDNQGKSGIFGYAKCSEFLGQSFCNRFGTFADQLHAIYALATFARAFHIEEPLEAALSCGNALRALQGERGQWWFRYDKHAGRVVNRYPLLSLHQDGIAPLGLLALSEATGESFHHSIYKGLSWTAEATRLGDDFRKSDRGLIWESAAPTGKIANYWEAALSLANMRREQPRQKLRIWQEARPDQFGWLLYAFGGYGLPKTFLAAKAATASNGADPNPPNTVNSAIKP
jgi:hypothetical protein